MHTDQALQHTLANFVAWRSGAATFAAQLAFTWPPDLCAFGHCFKGYTWALSLSPSVCRVYGIAPLNDPLQYPLANLEPLIFDPRACQHGHRGDSRGDLEHYLIVEVFNAKFARAILTDLIRASEWCPLDEHVLRRPPALPVPLRVSADTPHPA